MKQEDAKLVVYTPTLENVKEIVHKEIMSRLGALSPQVL